MTTDATPKPSALLTATLRAAHQLLDKPLVLDDPLALRILGKEAEAGLRASLGELNTPFRTALRAILAVRSRLAEDTWHDSEAPQLVILGAGLDTSPYRMDLPLEAEVYEVDLPGALEWKRDLLQLAKISEREQVHYVGVDFNETQLEDALEEAGFDAETPACFTWLGVTLYLTPSDVKRTLEYIGGCAPGTSVVFDYVLAPELLEPQERSVMEAMAASLAQGGEPWKSSFTPEALEQMLREAGFSEVEHFDRERLTELYLSGRSDSLRLGGATRLIRATV
ncbi:hypothetical protein GCM10027277_21900 [Pseudoduganella ginsengisoli]|uniref:S-adenosyl-L-methionine-dependent methyltransferase n=1 Tax=Pseudoduganella ginsengisoli TaxID=1462440 RepID=A0A6L6PTL5_9BURK|nr:SAM-dependent methyltransferase [Pseudoduganella ginsengisoli]MTW00556.1 SAM-dependent methyltransferase [Pseudoduganella ginsengisoli]